MTAFNGRYDDMQPVKGKREVWRCGGAHETRSTHCVVGQYLVLQYSHESRSTHCVVGEILRSTETRRLKTNRHTRSPDTADFNDDAKT